jgi:hypothetical protein
MTSMRVAAVSALSILAFMGAARGQSPVAVVEDVGGKPAGVEFMDYVAAGKVIVLGPQDSIVLGYMKSCWRETIMGGTVTVGVDQSEVRSGKVERVKVDCDAGRMKLTPQQAGQSAGMVFRDRPRTGKRAPPPTPQVTLFGLSPIMEVKGGRMLVVERIDQPGERHEIALVGARLVNGAFYDFAAAGKTLAAGATYRASLGGKDIVFMIDARARPGRTPIVGRLLRFEPAG